MCKIIRFMCMILLVVILFAAGTLIADKQTLRNDVIRLHVVGASDSEYDQNIKLAVKDAITNYVQKALGSAVSAEQAKEYLQDHLSALKSVANDTLNRLGSKDRAVITLTREEFNVREYDTFSLPSGIYESLRVEIGKAKGRNWWCVVFPSLCLPASQEEFEDVAVSSGMNQGLAGTLSGKKEYNIRFFLLDCWGKLENIFFFS